MPVRVDVVQRKLASMLRWAVERGLQVAAEAVFDTGNHILAGEFSNPADEYARIAERMSAHGVISRETATRLHGLSGFCNVLFHEYAQVDLGRLVEALERLDDLNAFVADVEGWLTRRESPH